MPCIHIKLILIMIKTIKFHDLHRKSKFYLEENKMIIRQYRKPIVPKYANYDYVQVYDGNDKFVGWIKMYYR